MVVRLARRPVKAAKAGRSQEEKEAARRASHRPSLEHARALALQGTPARGMGPSRPPRRASSPRDSSLRSGMLSRADSELILRIRAPTRQRAKRRGLLS